MSWAKSHIFEIFFVVNLSFGTLNVAHGEVFLPVVNYVVAGGCLAIAITERRDRNKIAKEI